MFDVILTTDDIELDSDEVVQNGSFVLTLQDAVDVTEELLVDTNSPQDAIAVTDSVLVDRELLVQPADSVDIADQLTTVAQSNRVLSDTADLTEEILVERTKIVDVLVSDALVITDTYRLVEKSFPEDTLSITETLTRATDTHRTFSEVLDVTDQNVASSEYDKTLSDTVAVTDSTLAVPVLDRNLSDSIDVVDSLSHAVQYSRNPSDNIVLFESFDVVSLRFLSVVVSDVLSTSDTSLAEVINVDVDVFDSIELGDSVSRSSQNARIVSDTLVVTETILAKKGGEVDRSASDSVVVSEALTIKLFPGVVEDTVLIADSAIVEILGEFQVVFDADGFGFVLPLDQETDFNSIVLDRFAFKPLSGGVPFQVESVTPVTQVIRSESYGFVQPTSGFFSTTFKCTGGTSTTTSTTLGGLVAITDTVAIGDRILTTLLGPSPSSYLEMFRVSDIGRYIVISNGLAPGRYRIVALVDEFTVTLDRPVPVVDPANGQLQWKLETAATALRFESTNKITNNRYYRFESAPLRTKGGVEFNPSGDFYTQGIEGPRLASVSCDKEGIVTANFDQPMMLDADLVDLSEYSITGPTPVQLFRVWPLSETSIALDTRGLVQGTYTLWVNYSGTPKDEGANPISPSYSSLTFLASLPERMRSIFTDKGPIAKPEELLQSGYGVTLHSANEITLIGATFTVNHVGKYLRLGPIGAASTTSTSVGAGNVGINETVVTTDSVSVELGATVTFESLVGSYKVLSVVSPTRVKIQASLTLPNASSVSTYWQLFDPRNGQIADSTSDVVVTINGAEVVPEAVKGLLGQVLLPIVPGSDDDVKVSYSWCSNPTVEVRTLNSPEFRLNTWNRNTRPLLSQHTYRYNNVLITPSDSLPFGEHALLRQPKLRELHYRGYERAYTPTLNDPTTLVLNSPVHRIAYPSTSRTLEETFVGYEATDLPESSNPAWERKGAGAASIVNGVLVMADNVSGNYPYGQPLFWTRAIDLTYPHLFALSWRFKIDSVTTQEGVFTGLAVGYSDEENVYVVGFLNVSGNKKVGFLKKGQESPGELSAWTGGLDSSGNPTGQPVDLDWGFIRSYRLLKDSSGRVRFFVDGNVVETLQLTAAEAPYLSDLSSPFDEIQGTFFGSLSRVASSTSQWDFVRYTSIPTNPVQVGPSIYVNYEGLDLPEEDGKPWTPVGSYGTETLLSGLLLLDSTSASTEASSASQGLVGGTYRAYFRLEPLLTSASQVVMEASVSMRSHTHGIDPNGLTMAVNDGTRLMQVSFLADQSSPKISYGGGSYPEDFDPFVWTPMGTSVAAMMGRTLRITDTQSSSGKVYFFEDDYPLSSSDRVVSSAADYALEFRVRVLSYTADGSGFVGAFAQVFDGSRAVGILLADVAGVKRVVFHSDGVFVTSFPYDWGTGFHTYRLIKNTVGNLVTLFVDGAYVGSFAYSSFTTSTGTAFVSFGSSTASSSAALSVVDWEYCNAWRILNNLKRFVGLWRGYEADSLTGYHLPTKEYGTAQVVGNVLIDPLGDFNTVVVGDPLVVDFGDNKGVYEVASVVNSTTLTIVGVWPSNPSEVEYRVIAQTDWTAPAKYRLVKDSSGQVMLFRDYDDDPLIQISYNSIDLPDNNVGILNTVSGGLPAIVFGSLNPEHLEQSVWDYVRYGIARSLTELKIVPHHQITNQWNVMESPERLYTVIPHDLTSFKSSSTGIAPKKDPALDLLENPALTAYTLLNEDTPLMPKTQAFENRRPYPVRTPIAGINDINNVLNSMGTFTLNNGAYQYKLVVPDDVLYSSLEIIEQASGDTSLIAPADDDCAVTFKGMQFQKEVCLSYDGGVLPENVVGSPTPWVLESDVPSEVLATALSGVLTYRTVGSTTVYKNNTPLPDAIGLTTEVKFRMRLNADATLGTGDTQVRFGVSAPGMTLALAFVTTPQLERLVLVLDLNANRSLGAFSHDFLDGAFHTYRILRDPSAGIVRVSIDA